MKTPSLSIANSLPSYVVGLTGPGQPAVPFEIHPPVPIPQAPATSPEALCSMNGFVKIGRHETRSHQVTGRGSTPAEAAANFFGCQDALEAGYAAREARATIPPTALTLPSRGERLASLLACGTVKALTAGDDDRLERLMKAYVLVAKDMVEEIKLDKVGQGVYRVRSQTDSAMVYTVQGRICGCQDHKRHAEETGWYCKHVLAALFVTRLDAQEQGAAVP